MPYLVERVTQLEAVPTRAPKYLGRRWWCARLESASASGAILSISSNAPTNAKYWAVSDSSDSNFCVYRDDVAHTHSLARVVRLLKGRLDASTGWGLCIYRAADGEPETKPVVCKQGEQ